MAKKKTSILGQIGAEAKDIAWNASGHSTALVSCMWTGEWVITGIFPEVCVHISGSKLVPPWKR